MLDKLREYCQKHKGPNQLILVVGYSQHYALEVHERTDIRHRVGQAKYLEQAARSSEKDVVNMLRQPGELPDKMLKAGLLIQRRSQELVPVDTSALKASAFTAFQKDVDQTATESHTRAEEIRTKVLAQRDRKK
jgi:hypothetical protein